jgi:proton-translocating NADH-quinone oxidoreductase chain L
LLLVFLPLIGFLCAGLFGRYLGSNGSAIITVSCLGFSLLISFFVFYEVSLVGCFTYIKLNTWINSGLLHVDWGFMFDSLTSIMCIVVTFISFLVHVYSTEYMSHDPHLPRFMSYLSLFTFFMLILVTADNFIQMFVGWEGVGLCSYLLINFWYTRIQANKAGIKAMILNRIGDFGLILGILLIFVYYKSVDYATVAVLTPFFKETTINFLNFDVKLLVIVGVLLFIGAVGKSAQVGLHTWLPDAMEGPTPVSALIHAATMVTAGVFLLIRSSFIYEYVPNVLEFITFLGATTAIFASSVGLMQNDMKRVIAYSTCSQLGYMVFACGLSNYFAGLFHLSNHAFFKALLFLGAGSVIHAVNDEQDMRKMGGLRYLIPFTYTMMLIGSLALMGFPFLTGFYSKDLILELSYGNFSYSGHFSYYLGTLGAFLTAFYSTRLLYMTFLSTPSGHKAVICKASESAGPIAIALAGLAIPSMFVGFYTKDMIVGLGSDFFGTSIFFKPEHCYSFDAEFIPASFKLLPLILSLSGVILAFLLYTFQYKLLFKIKTSNLGRQIYCFLNKKWFFDKVYNEIFAQFFFRSGYSISYKFIDRGILESMGPSGLSHTIRRLSYNFHSTQTDYLYHYTLTVLIGITALLGIRQTWSIFENFNDVRLLFIIFVAVFFVINFKGFDTIKKE